MERKYELLKNDIIYREDDTRKHRLYRIKALRDIDHLVKKGDLGGYIGGERNLSQEGECWVADNAYVFSDAEVRDDALVRGNATIYGSSRIYEGAVVEGSVYISGNSSVHGYCCFISNAVYIRDAEVCGGLIDYRARISSNAYITSQSDICFISGFHLKNIGIDAFDDITFFKCKDGKIRVNCCIFTDGTIDQFRDMVKKDCDEKLCNQCLLAADLAELTIPK